MQVVQLGLGHESAPVAWRERVAFSGRQASEALAELLGSHHVGEAALLATCNRTELYAVADEPAKAREALVSLLERRCGLLPAEISAAFRFREGDAAVSHLLRVSAGLESQILGEGQILGQVREAARIARLAGALGPVLEALFRHAVSAGKRVRSETALSRGAVSVGSAAVELARETLGDLAGRAVLLVGAGKLGELTLKHLAAHGVSRIVVANRTVESAAELARVVGGEAIPFIRLHSVLPAIDVVLCCTGAPHHLLSAADFSDVVHDRAGRPLVVVDVSVPRNVAPDVADLPGVRLFDIDHLNAVADRNRSERAFLVPEVEAILAQEREEWDRFLRSYRAAPTIVGLRSKVESLRAAEFEAFLADAGSSLSEEQLDAVETLTRRITAKFLHEPTVGLRDRGDDRHGVHARAIRDLFGLAAGPEHRRRVRASKR